MPDLYAILGVARDADTAAIRKAYRKASKRAHPDGDGSPEKFRAVSRAMEVLSDPARRKAYDETGNMDDKPVDNSESELMGLVSGLLDQVLKGLDEQGVPFENCDLIQRMKSVASNRQTEIHQHRAAIKEALAKQRKILKRFTLKKKSDTENRMESLIAGRLAWLEGQFAMAQRNLDALRKAELFLADYKFESENVPSRHGMQYYFQPGTF
jgi:curved DNA-binding protein CbpA